MQVIEVVDLGFEHHLMKEWAIRTEKNPAYGRQRISGPMRIVGPIQFWRGWVIYLKKKKS